MKYIILLITVLSILSCNNIGAGNKKMVCSQQSDLFYLGYKGRIKKITTKSGLAFSTDSVWYLDDEGYAKEIVEFDKNGNIVKERRETVNIISPDSAITRFLRYGTTLVKHYYEYLEDGEAEQSSIDTTQWVNDTLQIKKEYFLTDSGQYLAEQSTYHFDSVCMVSSSSFIRYNYNNFHEKPEHESFSAKNLDQTVIDARKKYGHLYTYYAMDSVKVLSTDKNGNPKKILRIYKQPMIEIKTYEYYK